MERLLSLINVFSSSDVDSSQAFHAYKTIKLEIETAAAFYEIKHSDCSYLLNMLDSCVKNKLRDIDAFLNTDKTFKLNSPIKELFVQKVANTLQNTGYIVPVCNTGVSDTQNPSDEYAFPRSLDNYKLISTPEGVVPVVHTVPQDQQLVAHDYVTFSVCQSNLEKGLYHVGLEREEALTYAIETLLDPMLYEIFGFGLETKRDKGMHFNKYAYNLQDHFGLVLYGNKNKRITIQINGTGCALARKGWQERLYKYLKDSISPKINRVDLCYDDFDGDFINADLVDQWDDEGQFICRGRRPDVLHLGAWKRPNGKGRTITVGSRESDKYFRGYERGKKEGDSLSLWFRGELELTSKSTYIPLDILLDPTKYYAGAYPALADLCERLGSDATPEKTEIVKKQSELNVAQAIEITKVQFGKYIRQFRKVFDDSFLLDLLVSDKDEVPKKLKFTHASAIHLNNLNQEIIRNDDDEYSLFTGVPMFNRPIYKDYPHAI